MEKRIEENKTRKMPRSLKKESGTEIHVKPKKVSQLESSPDKRHINVLNLKLNEAMAKISKLEWERDNLKEKVIDMSETLKKQNRSLKYYKSRDLKHDKELETIKNQYETDISSKEREIKNMRIQHEADILDKEKIILNQDEKITQQASSIEAMNTVREFKQNDDDTISKSKGSLLLDMIIFYENLGRVLNNDLHDEDIVKGNELMFKKINQLIEEFKSSPDFKEDIKNQVILSQLNDMIEYLNKVSSYAKSKEVLKEGVMLVSKDFKEVLANEGVEEIHTYGEKFDPSRHEAIIVEANSDFEDGYIIEELSKGYILNGKVIKPAQVKVCKNK